MKSPVILSFAAGTAFGALGFWLLQPAPVPDRITTATSPAKPVETPKSFLPGNVAKPEKNTASANAGQEPAAGSADELKAKIATAANHLPDLSQMEEMMRRNAETEVNREVDRLSLRLKLTGEQKDALRTFLTERKSRERENVARMMKGDTSKAAATGKEQSTEDFLKDLLNEGQEAEYAQARQEERTARAEDYATRKIRKLDRDLNLTQQQEDTLFQTFAQRKLTEPESQAPSENFMAFTSGEGITGHMSIAISGNGGGLNAQPIEIELPDPPDLPTAGGDQDRPLLEPVLTPEQLAVYDQRRKEQQEQSNGAIHIESSVQTFTLPENK